MRHNRTTTQLQLLQHIPILRALNDRLHGKNVPRTRIPRNLQRKWNKKRQKLPLERHSEKPLETHPRPLRKQNERTGLRGNATRTLG